MERFIRRMTANAAGISGLSAAGTGMLLNKFPSSSRRALSCPRTATALAMVVLFVTCSCAAATINLSPADTRRIGKRIWQNECNGTITGLTAWNEGENFASLGIGHFIWYPKGQRGPFEESFPKLVSFMTVRGVKLPTLLLGAGERACPWNSRQEFLRAQYSPEMK